MIYLNTRIEGLDDAIGVAQLIDTEYDHGLVCIFCDQEKTVEGYAIFDQPKHTFLDVIDWLKQNEPFATEMFVVEAVRHNPDQLCELDLACYEWLEETCTNANVKLLDWITINDGLFRSMAVTIKPNKAWGEP